MPAVRYTCKLLRRLAADEKYNDVTEEDIQELWIALDCLNGFIELQMEKEGRTDDRKPFSFKQFFELGLKIQEGWDKAYGKNKDKTCVE